MTRIEFVNFLNELKTDFEQNESKWKNTNLKDFLEGIINYTEDIKGITII